MNRENYECQKMNLINPSKEKKQNSWILKTVYGKHSIYFSDLKEKLIFLTSMWRQGFVIKEFMLQLEKIMDVRK